MSYALGMEDMGASPFVIDDSNYHEVVKQIIDPDEPYSGGYDQSMHSEEGLSAVCDSEWNGDIIPESQWEELIRWHDENQTTPDHHRLYKEVPITDQNGFPYCWMFGVVGAMMTSMAQSGIDVPFLSATYTAAMGKGWVKRGGWGAEAIGYIKKYGVPTNDVYPQHAFDRKLAAQESVKRSAAACDELEFIKLPTDRGSVPLEVVASVLLDPENPMPISTAFNWWGHLTYSSKFGRDSRGRWGHKNVNSWKESWGQKGCSFIVGSKARPNEAIAIRSVKARVA